MKTGTIPSKAAYTYVPGVEDQTISAGQYMEGAQLIKGDADLVAGNIKTAGNILNSLRQHATYKEDRGMYWANNDTLWLLWE